MAQLPYDLSALMRSVSALDGIGKHLDTVLAVQGTAARMMGIVERVGIQHAAYENTVIKALDTSPLAYASLGLTGQAYRAELFRISDALAGVTAHYPPYETLSAHFAKELATIGLPESYLPGLKALMPAEQLSGTIAKSLMFDSVPWALNPTIASILDEKAAVSARMTEFASWSGKLNGTFAGIDTSAVANLLSVSDITRSIVGYETDYLSRAYGAYAASVIARPAWLDSAPDFVRTAPAQSLLAQGRFVQTVTSREVDVDADEDLSDEVWLNVQTETQEFIATVLPQVRPSLMTAWEGVLRPTKHRGPDWSRQSSASLRFVMIAVLDAVAPPKKIDKSKLPKQERYFKPDGEVSRRGQVYSLCAPLKKKAYNRLVEADLESAMSIIDMMNGAVHRDESSEIEEAFESMYLRSAFALRHLLQLWKERH